MGSERNIVEVVQYRAIPRHLHCKIEVRTFSRLELVLMALAAGGGSRVAWLGALPAAAPTAPTIRCQREPGDNDGSRECHAGAELQPQL
jgi:hypothetical protein